MAQLGYPSLFQRHVGGIGSLQTDLIFSKRFTVTINKKQSFELNLNKTKEFSLKMSELKKEYVEELKMVLTCNVSDKIQYVGSL